VTSSKVARWLDLLAYLLQHRYPVSRDQIFEAVSGYREGGDSERARESARRMFERDKAELRALGIDISGPGGSGPVDEPREGYRLAPRDFYLPYLELVSDPRARHHPYPSLRQVKVTREDMRRLDRATAKLATHPTFPLAPAAASARRKLGFDLPLSVGAIERVLARPLEEATETILALLQRAVAERTAVCCLYWAIGKDREEARTIEPLGLFFQWGRWYCVASDRGRQARRTFRVDRLRDAALMKGQASRFTAPQAFSIRDYVGRAPWELSEAKPVTVQARLAFPECRWVMAQGLGAVIEPVLEDGGAILQFAVRETGPFLRWALTFGRRIEIRTPEAVARELEALRARVAALYAKDR
jgi:proteasome accessory factor B